MALGEMIERRLEDYRRWRRENLPGALGEFYRTNGPDRLLSAMELTSEDVVLDVGGYLGNWTAEVSWRYGCRSLVFEPVPAFQAELRRRFEANRRISIVEAGMAAYDGSASLEVNADGTSAYGHRASANTIQAPMLGVESAFQRYELREVGCLKLNIEGGEFEVLERMLELGLHRAVRHFLIQFHRIAATSEAARSNIQAALSQTHVREFDYPFVWERWRRR